VVFSDVVVFCIRTTRSYLQHVCQVETRCESQGAGEIEEQFKSRRTRHLHGAFVEWIVCAEAGTCAARCV